MLQATRLLTPVFVCGLILIPASVIAQTDMTVFGLELGKPPSIPECEITKVGKKKYDYGYKDKAACFVRLDNADFLSRPVMKDSASAPLGDETIAIRFPQPPRISVGEVRGTVINGKLERLRITTGGGPSFADADMADLTKKYGEPSVLEQGTGMNLLGARIPTVRAIWEKSELTVTCRSVRPDDMEFGDLEIETPTAAKAEPAKPQGPKL
jgi:hypothetical protein